MSLRFPLLSHKSCWLWVGRFQASLQENITGSGWHFIEWEFISFMRSYKFCCFSPIKPPRCMPTPASHKHSGICYKYHYTSGHQCYFCFCSFLENCSTKQLDVVASPSNAGVYVKAHTKHFLTSPLSLSSLVPEWLNGDVTVNRILSGVTH